ncbi:MAG: hypothetical protein JXQ30_13215 [Spirochaetes bacterium]|nr:hypothetical protein [Spirochaetota bacterium]
MLKRVFVFIVSLAALISIGLAKCAGNMPYADSVLPTNGALSTGNNPTGIDSGMTFSTSYLCREQQKAYGRPHASIRVSVR